MDMPYSDKFGDTRNVKLIGHIDIPGGGQVVVHGDHAFIGHIDSPDGTTILDVSDPSKPRVVSELKVKRGIHSHKVRVGNDIMLVNYERHGITGESLEGGLKVFDISDPQKPKEISFYPVKGRGIHRFDFDGRFAYLSPDMDGFIGNIVMILDLSNPSHPEEISRWWLPGQWIEGGEAPTWNGRAHRCHHPLRSGDRLYVSYWHGGFVILDISNIYEPSLLSHIHWSPPYPCPTHTALRIPHKIMDRDFLLVTDEDVDRLSPKPNAFMWMVDITDERNPIPVSTYRVTYTDDFGDDAWIGAHQPQEQVYDNIICLAWFGGGLRIVDISDPYRPTEAGFYIPFPAKGRNLPQTNDVFVDENRLIYIIDRFSGLDILEFQGG